MGHNNHHFTIVFPRFSHGFPMVSHGHPSQGPALPTMALPPADGMTSAQLGRAAMAMARQTGPRPSLGVSWGGVLAIFW